MAGWFSGAAKRTVAVATADSAGAHRATLYAPAPHIEEPYRSPSRSGNRPAIARAHRCVRRRSGEVEISCDAPALVGQVPVRSNSWTAAGREGELDQPRIAGPDVDSAVGAERLGQRGDRVTARVQHSVVGVVGRRRRVRVEPGGDRPPATQRVPGRGVDAGGREDPPQRGGDADQVAVQVGRRQLVGGWRIGELGRGSHQVLPMLAITFAGDLPAASHSIGVTTRPSSSSDGVAR